MADHQAGRGSQIRGSNILKYGALSLITMGVVLLAPFQFGVWFTDWAVQNAAQPADHRYLGYGIGWLIGMSTYWLMDYGIRRTRVVEWWMRFDSHLETIEYPLYGTGDQDD